MNIKGITVVAFAINIEIHKLSKLFSVISNKYAINPPNYYAIKPPKFKVLIITAYIVPSIFLGQILHAKTNKGNVFSSPITYIMTESPKQNNLSGIPNSVFFLVTNNIYDKPNIQHPKDVTTNYFLNSTNFRYLL